MKLKFYFSGRNDLSKLGFVFMFLGMSWRKKFICMNLFEIVVYCINILIWKCLFVWEVIWCVSCLIFGLRMVF